MNKTRTESVTVADLHEGDTITELGKVIFPRPVTLIAVRKTRHGNATMIGANGWFTLRAVSLTDYAVRIID